MVVECFDASHACIYAHIVITISLCLRDQPITLLLGQYPAGYTRTYVPMCNSVMHGNHPKTTPTSSSRTIFSSMVVPAMACSSHIEHVGMRGSWLTQPHTINGRNAFELVCVHEIATTPKSTMHPLWAFACVDFNALPPRLRTHVRMYR